MTAHVASKFKRTQIFVHPTFQLKYVSLILMLMFITAILCSFVVYRTSMALLGEKLASVYPQGRLSDVIGSVNMRILATVLLMAPVVAIIGIYLSHKIAGPADRMEKILDLMASGDFRSRMVVRRGDELIMISSAINRLQESLRVSITDQRVMLDKVIGELESLKDLSRTRPNDTASIIDNINRLETELKGLITEFDQYKLPPASAGQPVS